MSNRSDIEYKQAYVLKLKKAGYTDAFITYRMPCDVVASKNHSTFYFEIKSTVKPGEYFGSVTGNEMNFAIKNKSNYRFVLSYKNELNQFKFKLLTVDEMIQVCDIQSPRYYFNVNIHKIDIIKNKQKFSDLKLTEQKHNLYYKTYADIVNKNKKNKTVQQLFTFI